MDFINDRPIYLQIEDWIGNKILSGEWKETERIPSVRELGALLQVNPNTVMRTYERLQAAKVIFNRRGIGFFVQDGAKGIIREEQKRIFLEEELPAVFSKMHILSIDIDKIVELYSQYKKQGCL